MKQQVRAGEELNLETLKPFLIEQNLLNSLESQIEVSQFSNGFSNLTYLLKAENREYVLRRPPAGAIKRGHDMGREFKVLTGLNKGFTKAPKALAYTESLEVLGVPFYIMEKVEGIIINTKEAITRKITAPEFKTVAETWLGTFVELHELDYKKVGLADLGKPEGYVERQVSNWSKQYLKAATEELEEAGLVMKWLQDNQPSQYGSSLVHNDFKYDNVVFKDNSWGEINAVLDWEMCTIGDPLMDLGTSLSYWFVESDPELITNGFPSPTNFAGNPKRSELVEMYAKKSGRPINNLVFYYAYGLFKLAVIVQQIYYRYHNGLTTDPRFQHLNKTTEILLIMAWQAIQKNDIEDLF